MAWDTFGQGEGRYDGPKPQDAAVNFDVCLEHFLSLFRTMLADVLTELFDKSLYFPGFAQVVNDVREDAGSAVSDIDELLVKQICNYEVENYLLVRFG